MSSRYCARSFGSSRASSCDPPPEGRLAAVVKDKRPMGVRQECVDHMVRLVESERMGAHLRPSYLDAAHSVRLEHFDQPRLADRDIEMPSGRAEEDDIWNTGELSPH